jgi:hypothetical protein
VKEALGIMPLGDSVDRIVQWVRSGQ